ncbi:gmc oxidoreductase [Moniliophthora roreri MCA 2997]|uniref:Gmc oxidoreductase n=2 Tax=Moniliophthora roreri TaxID=221103 RepID=V2YPZ2_MONRO|nr:gmc oxidoreductase [Moniliophthora roreri MCA 2997]
MWHILFATFLLLSSTSAGNHLPVSHLHKRSLRTRNLVTGGSIKDSYDFVIVGGGLAGLVLASRLSEDSNTTVLVLEAGLSGDEVATQINGPANTYYNSVVGSQYDWSYTTAKQSGLGDRTISWPRGKILGGSSAINGMYLVRPSEIEVNAWQSMVSDGSNAASSWSWDEFYAAMKKTESFDPPSDDIAKEAGIQYDASLHGTGGPIHWGYPGYTFPIVGSWTESLANIGIETNKDAAGGKNWGGFITGSSINTANWTRSYSRSGYIDPLPPRSNLDILTSATVTKILFDSSNASNLTATGVQYASSAQDEVKTVKINKEVLLAGGTIGSAQVLMVSGVGPQDVLQSAGVKVLSNLPGVGQHLQDHLSTGLVYQTPEGTSTAGSMRAAGGDFVNSALFLSYINSATAYVNLTGLLGADGAASVVSAAKQARDSSLGNIPSQDSGVLDGYKAIYDVTTDKLYSSEVGQIELLLSITGGGIMIQAAIQHPLSQGHIYITSPSVFDKPVIDPGYLTHDVDVTIMREGMKMARRLGQTEPISGFLGKETSPGDGVNSDEEWNNWLRGAVGTEYHPTGSCAMLSKAQGGVVNAKLQVYGLANVRVADASVYPFEFSSHLGAPTYALAEQAAALIRAHYNGLEESQKSSSDSPASTSTNNSSNSNRSSSNSSATIRASGLIYCIIGFIAVLVTL